MDCQLFTLEGHRSGEIPIRVGDNHGFAQIHTRETMIELFTAWAKAKAKADSDWLKELKGKNLSCWCGNDELCHADVLIQMANQ
jgi:hypothetical protein